QDEQAYRHRLEGRTDLVDVLHALARHRSHPYAATRRGLDEADLLQVTNRLADRGAADAGQFDQVGFGQSASGLQPTVHDGTAHEPNDLVGNRIAGPLDLKLQFCGHGSRSPKCVLRHTNDWLRPGIVVKEKSGKRLKIMAVDKLDAGSLRSFVI